MADRFVTGGWWPRGDEESLRLFERRIDAYDHVLAFWYAAGPQGAVKRVDFWSQKLEERTLAICRDAGALVIASTTGSVKDEAPLKQVFSDSALRAKHIAELVQLAEGDMFAGVDVDYEHVPLEMRGQYTDFTVALGERLHSAGKLFSFTAQPASPSQDYVEIGKVADHFRVMCYDQHGPWNHPGPVSDIRWVEGVLQYTLGKVPVEKVIMGIPFYGCWWTQEGSEQIAARKVKVFLKEKRAGLVCWDDVGKQCSATIPNPDGTRGFIWFDDERAVHAKIELAKRYGLRGVSAWFLTAETDAMTEEFRKARRT